MSIIDRIFGRKTETRASSWDLLATMGLPSLAGGYIAPAVIEGNAAAFNAITVISEAVAALPVSVYRTEGEGVRKAEASHPVARLFKSPNDLQTATEMVAMMQANCLIHGAAYAEIERDGNGRPVALWPIHPGQITIERIPGTRRIRYQVSDEVGTRRLLPDEVFTIRDRWDDPFTPGHGWTAAARRWAAPWRPNALHNPSGAMAPA